MKETGRRDLNWGEFLLVMAATVAVMLIGARSVYASQCPESPAFIPWQQSMAQGGPFQAFESDGTPVLVGWKMCSPTTCPWHWDPNYGPSMSKLAYVINDFTAQSYWSNNGQPDWPAGWLNIRNMDDLTLYVCGKMNGAPIEGIHFTNTRRVRIEVCPGTVPPAITHDSSSDQIEFMGQCVKPVPEPGASLSTMIGSFVLALIRRLGR